MTKRPKYHFITIVKERGGTYLKALRGQTFGRTPVPTHIMETDLPSKTVLGRARRSGTPGDIYFAATLDGSACCLKAKDIHRLKDNDNVLFADAQDAFDNYLETLTQDNRQ